MQFKILLAESNREEMKKKNTKRHPQEITMAVDLILDELMEEREV